MRRLSRERQKRDSHLANMMKPPLDIRIRRILDIHLHLDLVNPRRARPLLRLDSPLGLDLLAFLVPFHLLLAHRRDEENRCLLETARLGSTLDELRFDLSLAAWEAVEMEGVEVGGYRAKVWDVAEVAYSEKKVLEGGNGGKSVTGSAG